MIKFLKDGYYGFYTNFYLEVVYLHQKSNNEIHNIITKVTAFDCDKEEYDELDLKFGKLNKEYNFGYKASIKSKVWLDKFLSTFPEGNFIDEGVTIKIGKLQKLKRQFVSCIVNKRLNSILKGCHGNYVFEYFDKEKNNTKVILDDFNLFGKINSELKELKIDLSDIPERTGNVLVTFPNGLVQDTERIEDTDLEIIWSEKMIDKFNGIYVLHRDSEAQKDYEVFPLQDDKIIFTEREYQQIFRLIDIDRNLVLLDGHNCKEFLALSMSISPQLEGQRCFTDNTSPISVGKAPGYSLIGHKLSDVDPIVRKYQSKLKVAKEEQELVYKQYRIGNSELNVSQEREMAMSHLVKLIKENGSRGIWIWDPYIKAEDIIELIIKHHKYDSEVRIMGSKKIYTSGSAISGLSEIESNQTRKEAWFERNKELLSNSSNGFGLNLEFRCAHSSLISSFHDRFLIFPAVGVYNEPKVWSLGISLNQFGQEHHILHQVGFPEYIIKAFDYYWTEFEDEENIVFKTKHDS